MMKSGGASDSSPVHYKSNSDSPGHSSVTAVTNSITLSSLSFTGVSNLYTDSPTQTQLLSGYSPTSANRPVRGSYDSSVGSSKEVGPHHYIRSHNSSASHLYQLHYRENYSHATDGSCSYAHRNHLSHVSHHQHGPKCSFQHGNNRQFYNRPLQEFMIQQWQNFQTRFSQNNINELRSHKPIRLTNHIMEESSPTNEYTNLSSQHRRSNNCTLPIYLESNFSSKKSSNSFHTPQIDPSTPNHYAGGSYRRRTGFNSIPSNKHVNLDCSTWQRGQTTVRKPTSPITISTRTSAGYSNRSMTNFVAIATTTTTTTTIINNNNNKSNAVITTTVSPNASAASSSTSPIDCVPSSTCIRIEDNDNESTKSSTKVSVLGSCGVNEIDQVKTSCELSDLHNSPAATKDLVVDSQSSESVRADSKNLLLRGNSNGIVIVRTNSNTYSESVDQIARNHSLPPADLVDQGAQQKNSLNDCVGQNSSTDVIFTTLNTVQSGINVNRNDEIVTEHYWTPDPPASPTNSVTNQLSPNTSPVNNSSIAAHSSQYSGNLNNNETIPLHNFTSIESNFTLTSCKSFVQDNLTRCRLENLNDVD